jgi:putative phage-type endonuclease
MQANRVQSEQGSADWLAFRKGKLTASKSAIILGVSPYQTPFGLWEEELGLKEPQASTPHMQRGLDIEDAARDWFHTQTFVIVEPAVVQHPTQPEFIASLDGLSADGRTILEIKNNRKELHELARSGEVCPMHYAQIQHQLFVTGLNECHYLSYREGDPILIIIKMDIVFVTDMVQKELAFKGMVDDLIPPELTEKDYEDYSHDGELANLMEQYRVDTRSAKFLQERADQTKKTIMEKIGKKNAKGTNWKVTKYRVAGRIDYDAILEHYKIDTNTEQFRKQGSFSYRITVS